MSSSEPSDKFKFALPRQKRIHDRLQLIGPGAAAFYRDACRLMALEPPMQATTHLVGHLLREIESSLRDALEPVMLAEPEGGPEPSSGRAEAEPQKVKSKAKATPQVATHLKEVHAVLAGLRIDTGSPIAQTWLRIADRKQDAGLHTWAHRVALGAPRPVDAEFRRMWEEAQGVLEVVVDRFEANYARVIAFMDELLKIETPRPEDVNRLKDSVAHSAVAAWYFFDNLQHAAWLIPLIGAGYFGVLPEPEEDERKEWISFPRWPQGQYLTRIAPDASVQEVVIQTIDRLPATRNVRVHTALLDALLRLPAESAARLVDRAASWVGGPVTWLVPERLSQLVIHLARGGQPDAALRLVRALFRLEPAVIPDVEAAYRRSPEPRGLFEAGRYAQLLSEVVAALMPVCGAEAFGILCELLDRALELTSEPTRASFPDDGSENWRAAVEDHDQNTDQSVLSALISAVRDAAMQHDAPAAVQHLEALGWTVAKRLALYVIRHRLPALLDAARTRVLNRTNFDDSHLWHEYWLLANACLSQLSPEDQATFFGWIDRGPDRQQYVELRTALWGEPPPLTDVDDHVAHWQAKRLAAVADSLDEARTRRLEELSARVGEPEHPDFDTYITTSFGPSSPSGPEDVAALSDDDLIHLLATWQPPAEDMRPSREGLGRVLSQLAAAEPSRFSRLAVRFRGCDPTYVRALLDGLWRAAQPGGSGSSITQSMDWAAVLTLGHWICEQATGALPRSGFGAGDPHWGWTKRALASLALRGLSDGSQQFPIAARGQVWSLFSAGGPAGRLKCRPGRGPTGNEGHRRAVTIERARGPA